MNSPSPSGCERCGRGECPAQSNPRLSSRQGWGTKEIEAARDCSAHAVNWRALYFEARTIPPEVRGAAERIARFGLASDSRDAVALARWVMDGGDCATVTKEIK